MHFHHCIQPASVEPSGVSSVIVSINSFSTAVLSSQTLVSLVHTHRSEISGIRLIMKLDLTLRDGFPHGCYSIHKSISKRFYLLDYCIIDY